MAASKVSTSTRAWARSRESVRIVGELIHPAWSPSALRRSVRLWRRLRRASSIRLSGQRVSASHSRGTWWPCRSTSRASSHGPFRERSRGRGWPWTLTSKGPNSPIVSAQSASAAIVLSSLVTAAERSTVLFVRYVLSLRFSFLFVTLPVSRALYNGLRIDFRVSRRSNHLSLWRPKGRSDVESYIPDELLARRAAAGHLEDF